MKDIFPKGLGQKYWCVLYMGAHYTQQNMVQSKTQKLGWNFIWKYKGFLEKNTVIDASIF